MVCSRAEMHLIYCLHTAITIYLPSHIVCFVWTLACLVRTYRRHFRWSHSRSGLSLRFGSKPFRRGYCGTTDLDGSEGSPEDAEGRIEVEVDSGEDGTNFGSSPAGVVRSILIEPAAEVREIMGKVKLRSDLVTVVGDWVGVTVKCLVEGGLFFFLVSPSCATSK